MHEEYSSKSAIEMLPSFDGWRWDPRANYDGSDRKDGLLGPDGSRYMVKFASKKAPRHDLATCHVNNTVSEYLSSHILAILGYPVHDTQLGLLNGEVVVLCRNFVQPGAALIEFGMFLRKHYDSGEIGKVPNIRQVYTILETDPMLSPQADHFKACFWERFVGDALVGNFDRHKGNFGYLVAEDDSVTASPVYDNGGTLYPLLSESGMAEVLADPREIMRRIRLYPKAALTLHRGTKVDFYDLMSSGLYNELTSAVLHIVPRIRDSMPAIRDFIDSCAFLSDIRKDFYNVMLAERMHFILEPAYNACLTRHFDRDARKRVEDGIEFGNSAFEAYWEAARETDGRDAADICASVLKARREKNGAGTEHP